MEHPRHRATRQSTFVALGLLLALGALGGACSSAGADTATSKDADCVESGIGPGYLCWTGCQGSVADICTAFTAHGGACVMDWPADPASFCSVYTPARGIDFLASADCGSYRAIEANGVDGGNNYYYDKPTGKLVAIVSHAYSMGTADCRGGPSDFVEPSCDFQPVSCPDGGDAGGTGGSGGADAGP